MEKKNPNLWFFLLALSLSLFGATPVDRVENFEFTVPPQVSKQGDNYIISFTAADYCDATVAIINEDGKIVRHLASGVLGVNAPAPFTLNSLNQQIVWDGKDNRGNDAGDDCLVKVSLGLKASYGGQFAFDPYTFPGGTITGISSDNDGNLYLFGRGVGRAYDKNGLYIKSLAPHPATLKPASIASYQFIPTTFGDSVINSTDRFGPFNSGMSGFINTGAHSSVINKLIFVVFNTDYRIKTELVTMGLDGATSVQDKMLMNNDNNGFLGLGAVHTAISPNGKIVYLGMGVDTAKETPYSDKGGHLAHTVFRLLVDSIIGPRKALTTPFIGETGTPGSDNSHFNKVAGIAVNRDGNIFVSDRGNNRIQVFDSTGLYIRTIAVEKPGQLFIHPVSDAIYCMTGDIDGTARVMTLEITKLSQTGSVIASFKVPQPGNFVGLNVGSGPPAFCLDAASTPPALWLRACTWHNTPPRVYRVEDRGDNLVQTVILPATDPYSVPWDDSPRIAVDPDYEEVYLRCGARLARYNGNTCSFDSIWSVNVGRRVTGLETMDIGPADGLIYARTGNPAIYGQFVVKFTREGTPVDFPGGAAIPSGFGPSLFSGSSAKGIWTGQTAESNVHQKGFDVAPNGDIYSMVTGARAAWLTLRESGAPEPVDAVSLYLTNADVRGDAVSTRLLRVFNSSGTEKVFNATPGMPYVQGVRVGSDGGIFLAAFYTKPADQTLPYGLAAGGKVRTVGTVIKVRNPLDTLPADRFYWQADVDKPETPNQLRYGQWSFPENLWSKNLQWSFWGMSSTGEANH